MNVAHSARRLLSLLACCLTINTGVAQQQQGVPVRRAQPVNEPPVARALPPDTAVPYDEFAPTPPPATVQPTEPPAQRQLDYANGLFRQKLFDLAIPEFEKYIDQYPGASDVASAYFFLGESYRALNKSGSARKCFQVILDKFGESDYTGPAAYVLAEGAFTEKNYAAALPLFHRAASKSKEPAIALSARYFEARCLETLDKKEEAAAIYLQVIDAKDPNPYRDDCRAAAASIFLSRGKRADALKQYDALSNEAQKPALKAEAAVRGGVIAVDLIQQEKGKVDKSIIDKATGLLQKGKAASEAGKFRAIAQVAMFRLQFFTNQYDKLLADYKKDQAKLPDEAR